MPATPYAPPSGVDSPRWAWVVASGRRTRWPPTSTPRRTSGCKLRHPKPVRAPVTPPLPLQYAARRRQRDDGSADALARQVAPPAAGALSDAQATEAVTWTNGKYDELSVGSSSTSSALAATGVFDEASGPGGRDIPADHHVSRRRQGRPSDPDYGLSRQASPQTATTSSSTRRGPRGIDITTETIAVHFDPTLADAGVGVRVQRPAGDQLGATAFRLADARRRRARRVDATERARGRPRPARCRRSSTRSTPPFRPRS